RPPVSARTDADILVVLDFPSWIGTESARRDGQALWSSLLMPGSFSLLAHLGTRTDLAATSRIARRASCMRVAIAVEKLAARRPGSQERPARNQASSFQTSLFQEN